MDETENTTQTPDWEKRFAEMDAKYKEELSALRREQVMLMSRYATPQAAAEAPREPQLSLDGLPDPVEDAKGYNAGLQERMAKWQRETTAYQAAQREREHSTSSRDQDVIAAFQREFPGYSVAGARAVAGDVLGKLPPGVDPSAYAYTAEFRRDVAAAYEREFGKPAAKEDTATHVTVSRSPEEEFLRTGGIPGGLESGGAPSGGGAKEPAEPATFADILSAGQKKAGLVW